MTRVIKTVCQMCYSYCGMDVTVKDDRILRVEGMREHPQNHGRLCAKGLSSQQLANDPKRLRYPLRRIGERGSGKWERITWNSAIEEITEKLIAVRDKFGPEYLGYYRGQGPGWDTNYSYVCRFMNAWGSPNIFTHGHLCFTPRFIAHVVTYGGYPEPDYENANCIMLIGHNPVYTSAVNYAPRIVQAKERGAKLIVVDPRFTNTASKADLFLQPRPGTDGALILSMIRIIIEEELYDPDYIEQWTHGFDSLVECVMPYTLSRAEEITWVPSNRIKLAAHMIATRKPALVVEGNGLEQHTNVVQTTRATTILRSLIRTVDEPGGSVFVPRLPTVDVGLVHTNHSGLKRKAVSRYPTYYAIGKNLTGVELIDSLAREMPYSVKALIVQGGDPIASLSETATVREALNKIKFLAVHDLYHTGIGQLADIILPAASFLERDLILDYRYRPSARCNLIAMQNKCIPPVGESKSDLDLIFCLAQALDLEEYFPWKTVIEAFNWQLAPNHIDVSWLREHPGGYLKEYQESELYRKYENEGFNTPSGKIEFLATSLLEAGSDPLPHFIEPAISPVSAIELRETYPYICSTGLKLGIHTHTQFRTLPWIQEIEPEPFAEIHPETAKEIGIINGDWVEVKSPQGSICVRARVTEAGRPKVIFVTHGYGEPYAGDEDFPNKITSETDRDPISGTTGNRSFLCTLIKRETKNG